MASPISTSEARLNCLCGAVAIPGTYLQSSTFPVRTITCHCNPCRYVTGGLLPVFAWLNAAPPTSVLANVKAYHFTDRCTRYFCTTCGCVCLVELPRVGKWACAAGIIEPPSGAKDVVDITSHGYVSGTVDGGLVPLLLTLDDEPVPLFGVGHSKNSTYPEEVLRLAEVSLARPLPTSGNELEAVCHCGGVKLLISPAESEASLERSQSLITSSNSSKHVGYYCACRSCRLATGISLQGWTHVPLDAVRSAANGDAIALGHPNGTTKVEKELKQCRFWSSDSTQRSFCGGCGATVFMYKIYHGTQGEVAVSAGILRAASGSMAWEWVEWVDGKIDHEEDMVDQTLADCVRKGWKRLGLQQGRV